MGAAFQALLEKAKADVTSVTVDEARERLNNGANPLLLDVREREAFAEGYIPGAENPQLSTNLSSQMSSARASLTATSLAGSSSITTSIVSPRR